MSDVFDISDLNLAGKVIVGKTIARGGYSDIFKGTLLGDGTKREVAIKVLRVQGSSGTAEAEERLRKHFYREILLWRKLEHSNIVPLLGYLILPDEPPTLVSPWYINGNVIRYLELHPVADRQALALDVVVGLEYLHSIPVAHGDLKGENVLVDGDGRASLCDFGMSQFIDEASRIAGFTTTNANVGGTDRFMCPELLDDEGKSPATDIWAVGCLILQILTDEIPYQHIAKKSAIYAAILGGKLPSTKRNDTIRLPLWHCLQRCWSFIPSERPTASGLGQYLTSIIDYTIPAISSDEASPSTPRDLEMQNDLPHQLLEQVMAKRMSNTLAARRSRVRKLQTAREQEERIQRLQDELDMWKKQIQEYDKLSKLSGIPSTL